jgi:hypothetical protein
MDRVGGYVRVTVLEVDVDHNQVVDMVQVVANLVCGELPTNTSNHQVSRRSISDFIGYMARHMKLPISPTKLELVIVSQGFYTRLDLTHALCMHVDVVPLGIGKELGSAFNKRDGSRTVIAYEYVQEPTTTNDTDQIFVCRALREIGNVYGTLIVNWDSLGWLSFAILRVLWRTVNGGFRLVEASCSAKGSAVLRMRM